MFERILGPYVENLRTIGIPATIRLVDPSQFQARLEEFDFDIVGIAIGLSALAHTGIHSAIVSFGQR